MGEEEEEKEGAGETSWHLAPRKTAEQLELELERRTAMELANKAVGGTGEVDMERAVSTQPYRMGRRAGTFSNMAKRNSVF